MSAISEYVFPSSFAQRRLWFLDSLSPGLATYNVPSAYRLDGPLDASALQRALDAILERHDVFRTVFRLEDGEPVQIVSDALHPMSRLQSTDLSAAAPAKARALAATMAHEDAMRPFDLEHGPLIRSHLVRLAAEEHVLIVTMHHIVTDAWSRGIFFRELATQYQALREGNPAGLPPLEVQYGDYAVWQHSWLQGDQLQKRLEYWRQQLQAPIPVMDLPRDHPRPAMQSTQGARLEIPIPDDIAAGFLQLCRREEITLFAGTFAAFSVFLHRETTQSDILIGSPIAGRQTGEVEGLIGFFVNTLVLRTSILPDESFADYLGRAKRTVLDALAHQDVPFEKLVEELKPERDPSRNPFFQTMLVVQHAGEGGLRLPGVKVSMLPGSDRESTKFDLTLFLSESAGRLRLTLEYSTELFDTARVAGWGKRFTTLLKAIADNPETPVGRLSLLSAEERHQLVEEWNADAAVARPLGAPTLAAAFEAQVARTPKHAAVEYDGASLSYGELNAAANRVAHALRAAGIGPETLVALCAERSLELVIGLLGILKAGGAYVPVDLTAPADRVEFLLTDSGSAVVLTQRHLLSRLPPNGPPALVLEDLIGEGSEENPSPAGTPESLAYVIYTSGSTGQPKGVEVTQANVLRLFLSTEAWFHFGPGDVWTLFHSYAFDFSVWELWGALLYGGRLVVVPYEVSRTPEAFVRLVAARGVTVLNQTPSAFWQFQQADATLGTPALALRLVIFGGEALEPATLAPWYARRGESTLLVNMYGITETTVHVTYRPLSPADLTQGSVIGWPIPDLEVYVLDGALEPVPIGVPGELYVGGAGVARGYLNRPALTAERFVPNPFRPGTRLYRTGDQARWRPGRDLEYLGRLDFQVKIRGFRIELGEIEAALAAHPDVANACAIVREDVPGDKRLVAYVVAKDGVTLDLGGLRTRLKRTLPDYMVPSGFVPLPALPMTSNGKLDRKALPAPQSLSEPVAAAPTSTLEAQLLEIWSELFPGTTIGVNDDFFELGGHSLLVVRMVNEITRATGLKLPLALVFQGATVRDIARHLLSDLAGHRVPDIVEVQPGKPGVPGFFMAHGDFTAGGFYCRNIASAAGPDQPVYAIPPLTSETTIEAMAIRHLAAVRKVQPQGPYRFGGYCVGGLVAFEMARQLRAAGETVDYLVVVDSSAANARYRWVQPWIAWVCAITERDPVDRADRFTYLMSRVRRLRYMPAPKLTMYLAGWPARLLARRMRRVLGLKKPVRAAAPPSGPLEAAAARKLAHHFTRAQMLYFPKRFDGRVDVLWAIEQRRIPSLREVGWGAIAAEAEMMLAQASHVEVVTTHLPGMVAEALARLNGTGVTPT